MNFAIVLSGGSGKRFNNEKLPKQFVKIKGTPLFIYSLLTYSKIHEIRKIFLTINSDYKKFYVKYLNSYNLTEKIIIVSGGATRCESIKNALSLIDNEKGVIVLQNAASPYTKIDLIKKCIKEAKKYGASQAYKDIEHTIFSKKDKNFENIVDKKNFGFTVDPTVYKTSVLKKTFQSYKEKIYKSETTLDFMNMMDIPVKLIKSEISNIKITLPTDLTFAKNIFNEFMS